MEKVGIMLVYYNLNVIHYIDKSTALGSVE